MFFLEKTDGSGHEPRQRLPARLPALLCSGAFLRVPKVA